jgi:hypothetical protein
MTKSPLSVVRSLLHQTGYLVLVRTNAWTECFVQRGAERWEGRGHSEAEALDDALVKMLPSNLSRALFEQHAARGTAVALEMPAVWAAYAPITTAIVAGGDLDEAGSPGALARGADHEPVVSGLTLPAEPSAGEAEIVTPAAPDAPPILPDIAPPAVEAAGVSEAPLAAEAAAPEPPPAQAEPALIAALRAIDAPPANEGAEIAAVSPAAAEPAPIPPTPRAAVEPAARAPEPVAPRLATVTVVPARVRTADALETVDRMLNEIEGRLDALARMSGERQRLHMMVWICRARAVEEANPGIRDVEQAVARVARRLTDIGKMFWPGSVRALQLSARPADVRREMHATWAPEPANWREATVLAERLLDEHLVKSAEAGLDEDGWADAAARSPRPPDPEALFKEVDEQIKALLIPPGEVPNGRAGELAGADFDRLLAAARKLRWLRGGMERDLDWGVAVGRVRRAIPSLGERGARVREILDHKTKPSAPWAKILGESPEPAPPGESPEELRKALPAATVTKDLLLAWLIRAFDVLNTPDLVALMVPIKHILAEFSEETLNHPDRRVRRRLRELVKRVGSAEDTPTPPAKSEPVPKDDDTIDEPVMEHALAALAARVRARTQGRNTLFVSNREDPELGARLEELLGIHITWCDGSLRRVQAQCERIKGGSYSLILSATGFQVHGVDSAVAGAASAGGVPYVRVNRGRPVACVQAIAREFGMGTFTYSKLDPQKASSAD